MSQSRSKVGSFDELERQIVCAASDPKVEHPGDMPVMQERRQPCFTKKHLDKLRVADKRWQNSLETNTLLKPARPASNRQKRLGHPANPEPLNQLVVAKTFVGRRRHEPTKVTQRDRRGLGSLKRLA